LVCRNQHLNNQNNVVSVEASKAKTNVAAERDEVDTDVNISTVDPVGILCFLQHLPTEYLVRYT
jgi:hypothetical protein